MRSDDIARSVRFFALTLVLSWIVWVGLYHLGILSAEVARLAGTWGPTVAAFYW